MNCSVIIYSNVIILFKVDTLLQALWATELNTYKEWSIQLKDDLKKKNHFMHCVYDFFYSFFLDSLSSNYLFFKTQRTAIMRTEADVAQLYWLYLCSLWQSTAYTVIL